MSRVDELRRAASDSSQPTMAFWRDVALTAIAVVGDLESDLAARDERIAELDKKVSDYAARCTMFEHDWYDEKASFEVGLSAARAEVPEWCQEIVLLAKEWNNIDARTPVDVAHYREYKLALACEKLSEDQLRACGIDVP